MYQLRQFCEACELRDFAVAAANVVTLAEH